MCKHLRISVFTAATRLGLGSSLLMVDSVSSLSIISMFLFDCWISLSSRGIICWKGRLIHYVLLVVDTTVSKDTPLTRPSFPLINFVICHFFHRRRVQPQYFKAKYTEHDYWSNQKLFHHSQHAKNQLNSSIYFSVEIKQILESQDLKGHSYIWPCAYPK